MSAAAVLVAQLADARGRGEGFAAAWPGALSSALAAAPCPTVRGEWVWVLGGMASTWRDAFERRRPAGEHEQALALLADDSDRVPMPERPRRIPTKAA